MELQADSILQKISELENKAIETVQDKSQIEKRI